jgi:glycerate dehydrogenase
VKSEISETIVFLDVDSLGPDVVTRRLNLPHTWTADGTTPVEYIVERAGDATILVVNKVPLQARALWRLPRLRLV